MKKTMNLFITSAFLSFATLNSALSIETKSEKVEAKKNIEIHELKDSYRKAKDETCKEVNGKLECVKDKINNEAKSVLEKAKLQNEVIKNKID